VSTLRISSQNQRLADRVLTGAENALTDQHFRDLEANSHASVSWALWPGRETESCQDRIMQREEEPGQIPMIQNLSPASVPPYLQWAPPILKSTSNTLLCSRFVYGKQISTRTKSVRIVRHPQRQGPPKDKRC
jgi:hypothetical protein